MDETVGSRVAYWRRRRGMSQRVLAGLAGVSQPYVSQVEHGVKTVDRRSTLTAFAAALQVDVNDLLGLPPAAVDPTSGVAAGWIPGIRLALVEAEETAPRPPTTTREQFDAVLDETDRARGGSDYVALAGRLAALIREGHAHGGIRLARTAANTSVCLRNLGYRDLARVASRIAVAAANDDGSPAWIGAAQFFHALALPVEAADVAEAMSSASITALQGAAGRDRDARQMLGQLHLTAAHAAAAADRPRDAEAHLAAADAEAASLGDPEDGAGFTLLCFGPTNIALWRMTLAAELGDPAEAVRIAQGVHLDALAVPNRHRAYWETYGRALAAVGRDHGALAAFRRAEQLGPAVFAVNPRVHDAVAAMVARAHARAVPPELRVLARRAGVKTA